MVLAVVLFFSLEICLFVINAARTFISWNHYPPFWWSKLPAVFVRCVLDNEVIDIEARWELILFSYALCAHCLHTVLYFWPDCTRDICTVPSTIIACVGVAGFKTSTQTSYVATCQNATTLGILHLDFQCLYIEYRHSSVLTLNIVTTTAFFLNYYCHTF